MISKKLRHLSALFLLLHFGCSGQNAIDSLLSDFNSWKQIPVENVHLHINKSGYFEGEHIGFTAYVIDQRTKKPSIATKNLYLQLLNDQNKIIKEKLLYVEGGIATNVFVTDSTTPPGNYSIKAFTNWMRNFEKPLFAQEPIKIIDPSSDRTEVFEGDKRRFELSILPEGGHAIDSVFVKMGAILKDQYGNGTAAIGKVLRNGSVISSFTLDDNGIGSFQFLPNSQADYAFEVEVDGQTITANKIKIDNKGVGIAVIESQSNLFINLRTNNSTLERRNGEDFIVTVNGENNIKGYRVALNNRENLIAIPSDSLYKGINQILYFDKNGNNLGRRLFFNFKGLDTGKVDRIDMIRNSDSLDVTVDINKSVDAMSSISILPQSSINIHEGNILQKFFLDPYLKVKVQNVGQYFDDKSTKRSYQMDNLLLTQGWSRHDWSGWSDAYDSSVYQWETGIDVNLRTNSEKDRRFIIYPSKSMNHRVIELDQDSTAFQLDDVIVYDEEYLRVGKLDRKGRSKGVKLYARYSPDHFPKFRSRMVFYPVKIKEQAREIDPDQLSVFGNAEMLGEVLIEVDREQKRRDSIQDKAWGDVHFFSDAERIGYTTIDQYLQRNGFQVEYEQGFPKYTHLNRPVSFILNGDFLYQIDRILTLDTSIIDYVEIDNTLRPIPTVTGLNTNVRVEISLDPKLLPVELQDERFSVFKLPLAFASEIEFYTPNYLDYNSEAFKKLGVIDWQGKLQIENGKAEFTMPYVGQDSMWFIIEGMAEDGTLIHSVQQASVTQD